MGIAAPLESPDEEPIGVLAPGVHVRAGARMGFLKASPSNE